MREFRLGTGILAIDCAVPKGAGWGCLACLQNTPWGDQIPQVSRKAMEEALYGHLQPLMKELGSPPNGRMLKLPGHAWRCSMEQECHLAGPECYPCKKMPICYDAAGVSGVEKDTRSMVARYWAEGRFVFTVEIKC